MTRRGLALLRQLGGFAVLAVLALSLCGDRTSAAGVPATIFGQDPLEVLELKVRPNVILVFDSSSSMQGALKANLEFASGDHPRTRNHQGKKAISDVVKANQDKVSFQFGTYTAYQPEFAMGETDSRYFGKPGYLRWQYMLDGRNISCPASPTAQSQSCATSTFMTTAATELSVQGAVGDTLGRGLQSWQIIYPEWNRLYFGEASGAVCYATLPAVPTFYARGSVLAAALQTAMNAPTCTSGSRQNTYTVSYDIASGTFSFSSVGPTTFQIRWAAAPNNIAGALGKRGAADTTQGTSVQSGRPYTLLYRNKVVPTVDCGNNPSAAGCGPAPFPDGMPIFYQFTEAIPVGGSTNVKFHQLGASRLWNGETIRVTPTGEACAMTFATPLGAGAKTNPGSLVLQGADASCNPLASGNSARFEFAGGFFRGTNGQGMGGCGGFRSRSDLVPCDLVSPPAPLQFDQIGSQLENELPLVSDAASPSFGNPKDFTTNDATGVPGGPNYLVPDGKPDYLEDLDGSWATSAGLPTQALLQGTVKIRSGTPIANSLIDIKGTANAADTSCVVSVDPVTDAPTVGPCPERGFTKLWNQGQVGTTNMAGPPPWQLDPIKDHGTCPDGTSTCPSYQRKPKEKTIVLFVTDGGDSCTSSDEIRKPPTPVTDTFGTAGQRRAAYYAAELYRPLDPLDSASSVTTYIIGYGGGITGLDWIGWGGSGLGQEYTGQAAVDFWNNTSDANLKIARSRCTTCVDAFVAPDAETLTAQLQALIDRGAADGEFNAQQSITESVFEYVDKVPTITADASMPTERYDGIVPTRFVSSFTLPGFRGHLSAYQSDGATPPSAVLMWDAGAKLMDQVMNFANIAAFPLCSTQGNEGPVDTSGTECAFDELHGKATDADVATKAKIKRRIYTTSRNGVYTFDAESLMSGKPKDPNERVSLWPPASAVLSGTFDDALGLPPNTPTSYPPGFACGSLTMTQCWIKKLQDELGACTGINMPNGCTSSNSGTKLLATKAEAREITLAFLAGATPALADAGGLKRARSGPNGSRLFYKRRDWILADAELATAAVVTPPSLSEPSATPYVSEYKLYRDGTRSGGKNVDAGGTQIFQGFGLTQPDDDQTVGDDEADTRVNVKPVMTVVYAPANDGLHAFRAGPCDTPALNAPGCTDTGGEELWSFVPYDQLHTLLLRAANEPQGRADHVYSLANGVRFADVFVKQPMTGKTIGGVTVPSMLGVWRRILYFGRGIGGKYVSALDVTGTGPYTTSALSTGAPIPLWSRGNPDYQVVNGTTYNHDAGDYNAYRHMGETWSMPTVAYVKPVVPYATSRSSNIDFVLFMGSGYGNPATYGDPTTREGTTHYTLDALSGDVIATADVEERTGEPFPNAIVANSVSFNRSAFESLAVKAFNTNPHPWSVVTTRVYVGDLHGRLWKFLVETPGTAIPAADFGPGQPIGTPVALLGEPLVPGDKTSIVPNIFVTTGADRRVAGPFVIASLIDRGDDFSMGWTGPISQTTGPPDGATVSYFPPVEAQFTRYFAEGTPEGTCTVDLPKAVFRGTIQPTSAVECSGTLNGSTCEGSLLQRVFFGGTRLSAPNTLFAPPTPLACPPGQYPCRSQFDTILYALGVESGVAAYDLNPGSEDAYRIFRDSRIAAISFQADPNPGQGGSRFAADEGLIKGAPKPPPPPGVPPTTTVAGSSVMLWREPGQPAPVVQYGSTVCQ